MGNMIYTPHDNATHYLTSTGPGYLPRYTDLLPAAHRPVPLIVCRKPFV